MNTIMVDRVDGVVTITLNRPDKKNAVDATMWRELLATFREVTARPDDRVLVLTGAGGSFCSGADLSDRETADAAPLQYMRGVGDVALALYHLPKPTLAKVRGAAVGAGWNLALACDLVVAANDARFSQIFVQRGRSVDFGGSWILPRLIGVQRAKQICFFGDFLSGEDAHALGLANHVLPDDELDAFVDEWARRLAAGPPIALSMTKTLLGHGHATSIEQALEDEARCQSVCMTTEDGREAVQAFAEKRAPVFRGR